MKVVPSDVTREVLVIVEYDVEVIVEVVVVCTSVGVGSAGGVLGGRTVDDSVLQEEPYSVAKAVTRTSTVLVSVTIWVEVRPDHNP